MKKKLMEKIKQKKLVIGVIGLGYVGLPLAVEKAKAGYRTIGFDIQDSKVDMVNKGINYIGDVVDSELKSLVLKGKLSATKDFSFISEVDFIAICVPTPLDDHQQPDVTYLVSSTTEIAKYLKKETIVVLESTTYPGTTEELILPILEKGSKLKSEKDFYLGFSPERVDPGNKKYKTKNTPKVVGGVGKDSCEVIANLYRNVLDGEIYEVSSPAVAEMEKILENTYRNINIALVNEMAILCHKMGINVWEVIDAAKTKPYGFQAFYPGPGVGGHCIPLDPYYLTWKAREYGFHTQLIETSSIINDLMPEYIVERSSKILNRFEKCLNKSMILMLGVAYKPDINDYRESPALKVYDKLRETGAIVEFYDPYLQHFSFRSGEIVKGIKEYQDVLIEDYDLVVITTGHRKLDYTDIQKRAKYIFDTKNATKEVVCRDNIELL